MQVEATGAEPEAAEQVDGWVLPPAAPHSDPPALTAWPCSEELDGGADAPPESPPTDRVPASG